MKKRTRLSYRVLIGKWLRAREDGGTFKEWVESLDSPANVNTLRKYFRAGGYPTGKLTQQEIKERIRTEGVVLERYAHYTDIFSIANLIRQRMKEKGIEHVKVTVKEVK